MLLILIQSNWIIRTTTIILHYLLWHHSILFEILLSQQWRK